ncbi:MAG TPA: YitT family protein [Oscillospiraceae bacterium]|nr:YitT family protein [Oscillospiraceae bacterium]
MSNFGKENIKSTKSVKQRKLRVERFYFFTDFLSWCVGSALYAIAIDCFSSPNNIAPGGVTGISTLINYKFSLPIGVMILALNIPIFIAAYRKFGMKFIARTIIGTVLVSVFIDIGKLFLPVYTGDRLLAAIFGGAVSGIGLGIILAKGATSGGADIIGRLLKLRFPHISLGSFILAMDVAVMFLAGVVYGNIESMLYSAVFFFLSSRSIDYLVYGASKSSMLLIVTTKGDTLPNKILTEIGRGVTMLPVTGAYTGQEKKLLLTVARPHETAKITRIVKEIDPDAFVIKTEAGEVLGKGFKTDEKTL